MDIMNITLFKQSVLLLNLNKVEKQRIIELISRCYKRLVRDNGFTTVNESNYKSVWFKLNNLIAEDGKFHRIQTHSMMHSKGFGDYSNLAYNNVTDDF